MKKLYTFCIAVVLAVNSYAQSYDIGVTGIIKPDTTQNLAYNYNDTLIFEFTNFGDALPTGDTISFILSVDVNGTQTDLFSLGLPLSFPVPMGTTIPVSTGAPIDLTTILSQFQGQQLEVCVRAEFSSLTDVNSANNQYCNTYTVTSAPVTGSYDVATGGILNPDTAQNLPSNFNDTITVYFENIGDPLMSGDTLSVTIDVTDNSNNSLASLPLLLPIGQTISTGGLVGISSPTSVDLSSSLAGLTGQNVTVCITTTLLTQTDVNTANDQYCYTYTVGVTTGILDLEANAIGSFFANGMLNIENNKAGHQVMVYNTNGQVVFQSANGNSSYELNLSKGIYVINVTDGANVLHRNKVLVY